MSSIHTSSTADSYAGVVSQRLAAERVVLASLWLQRLQDLLVVQANDIFPSESLLDHIPELIDAIASYIRAPAEEEIAADTTVMTKARELGVLRHEQQASVHQLLREYEVLGDILERFVIDVTRQLRLSPSSSECFDVLQRLTRSTRTLMRTTVDTFLGEYTTAIQERNHRIRRFNEMASHELRSPVGTLLFAATLLTTDTVRSNPQRLVSLAKTIRENAERLSSLIDNLQRLTRLTDPVDTPSEQVVDLGSVAAEVARQLAEMAAARNISIRIGPLPSLVLDPARLELILLNLVSNAIKYTDPAKPHSVVEIFESAGDRLPGAVTVCVSDNGLGIAEGDQPTIFERFVRAHSHLDGELGVSGSGLGLAIVAECIQALEGSIRLESTPGQGTTVFIRLPMRAVPGA